MEINYSINAPSVIKLNSFAKCFDILDDLLAVGSQNGEISLFNWIEEKDLIRDFLNTSDKEQVISVKLFKFNQKLCLFSQNRCGIINSLEIINNNDVLNLLLVSSLNTYTETYTRFSFIDKLIYCPLLERTGLRIIKFSSQKLVIEEDVEEVDFKNDNPEMKIENLGVIMTISEELIENKFLILGYETATISLFNTLTKKLEVSSIKFSKSNDNNSFILSISFYKKSSGNYKIYVGSFSCQIAIFMFDPINKLLELCEKLDNCCFNLKPGISSISVLKETSLLGIERSYLITGSFDYRIRFYDLEDYKPLGQLKYNSSRINQIKLSKNDDNIFLFVACDENCFYIWLIS